MNLRILAAALLPGLALAAPASAQPLRAVYEVYAAGLTVLQLEAVFDIGTAGYRVETTLRTRGLAAAFVPGEQATRVQGGWSGVTPRPVTYRSEGVWRGTTRRIALDWLGVEPSLVEVSPPEAEERDPVSAEERRGTMDALSALALLSRAVQGTGSCEGQAAVFDGRRRSEYSARSLGRELISPWRGAWHGEALRCSFEARQVAGFLRSQVRADAAAPQPGTAWLAAPFPGAPPIPVRIEVQSRWFGTATAVLLRAEAIRAP